MLRTFKQALDVELDSAMVLESVCHLVSVLKM